MSAGQLSPNFFIIYLDRLSVIKTITFSASGLADGPLNILLAAVNPSLILDAELGLGRTPIRLFKVSISVNLSPSSKRFTAMSENTTKPYWIMVVPCLIVMLPKTSLIWSKVFGALAAMVHTVNTRSILLIGMVSERDQQQSVYWFYICSKTCLLYRKLRIKNIRVLTLNLWSLFTKK